MAEYLDVVDVDFLVFFLELFYADFHGIHLQPFTSLTDTGEINCNCIHQVAAQVLHKSQIKQQTAAYHTAQVFFNNLQPSLNTLLSTAAY